MFLVIGLILIALGWMGFVVGEGKAPHVAFPILLTAGIGCVIYSIGTFLWTHVP